LAPDGRHAYTLESAYNHAGYGSGVVQLLRRG
jgi:hypothetical protein